jgi:alginate O-acetyltransferase complex protein AlgI
VRRRLYIRDFDSLTRNTNVVGGIMTFNSYQFILLFLPIALIGSYVCVHFKRNWKKWLLAISLVFYACNGVKYLPFIRGFVHICG